MLLNKPIFYSILNPWIEVFQKYFHFCNIPVVGTLPSGYYFALKLGCMRPLVRLVGTR